MIKSDLYTKIVLSTIAFCLVILTANQLPIFPKAIANDGFDHSYTPQYGIVPLNDDGSINISMETMDVRIVDINTYDMLPVQIKDINTYDELKVDVSKISTDQEVDVNIDEIGGSYLNMGGPIPVKIKE